MKVTLENLLFVLFLAGGGIMIGGIGVLLVAMCIHELEESETGRTILKRITRRKR